MSTGWVYILSNPSIPDRVKVGWTKGRPEIRARELQSTGVPAAFKVETALLFSNRADQIERKAHELLSDKRVSLAREFFECKPLHALEKIFEAAEILEEPVRDTDPILVTEKELLAISESKQQERLQQEEERRLLLQRQEQAEEERIKKEKELQPAVEEYFFYQNAHASGSRFRKPNDPYLPFPSFEEWNSPEARAERIRKAEANKSVRFHGKTHAEWIEYLNDRSSGGNGCLVILLFILGLVVIVAPF